MGRFNNFQVGPYANYTVPCTNHVEMIKFAYDYLKSEYNIDITDYNTLLDIFVNKLTGFIDSGVRIMKEKNNIKNLEYTILENISGTAIFTFAKYINNSNNTSYELCIGSSNNVNVINSTLLVSDGTIQVNNPDAKIPSDIISQYASDDLVDVREIRILYKLLELIPDYIDEYSKTIPNYFTLNVERQDEELIYPFKLDDRIIKLLKDNEGSL